MRSDKVVTILLIIGSILTVLLFLWDCLTTSPYQELTLNPFNVDWQVFSLKNIDVNSIIQTLLSALVGFLLTIVFIELLLKRSRDKEQKYKQQVQFKNISKIIKVPLFRYHKAALSITNEIGKLPEDNKVHIPFESKILANVFMNQTFADEPLSQTNIEFYAKAVGDLQSCITNILLNVDLSNNDELSSLLSDYVMIVSGNNPCTQILDMTGKTVGQEKMTDFIKRELPNVNLETVQPSNLFYPFARLKDLIVYHEEFIGELYALAPDFNIENQ